MIVFGLISSIFDILTFVILLQFFHAEQPVFQTSWFVVSLLTELVVVLVLRTHKFSLSSRPSALLLWSTIAVSVLALASPFLGKLSAVFGFTPLPGSLFGAIGAIVLGYIAATEAAKAWFFRRAT
jgi:Mg2+-importing ATPase